MNDFKRGERARLGVYDDWMHGDDCVEFIAPSPEIMHDKFTAERHSKILEELDSFTINLEYKPASMKDSIDSIIKKFGDVDD